MWLTAGLLLVLCVALLIPSAEDRQRARLVEYIFDQQDRTHLRSLIESDPAFLAMTEQEKQRFLDEAIKILW